MTEQVGANKKDILETFPLEKEELESVENGSDISLKLEVKDIAEEVRTSEESDKVNAAVENAVEKLIVEKLSDSSISDEKNAEEIARVKNAKIAAVLDVTIEKFIDGVDAGKVTELKKPLRVYIDLPEGLYEEGRSYFVVREHNGEYEALELHIIDSTRAWFESKYYSKFFIMYTEEAKLETDSEQENIPELAVEPEEVIEPASEQKPDVEPESVVVDPVIESETKDPCADGHDYGEWKTIQNASWLHDGIEVRVCEECGETETRVSEENWTTWAISALGRRLKRLLGR